MPARLRTLAAGFDSAALRPFEATAECPPWPALQAWCHAGLAPGAARWWRPGAAPAGAQRLTVAQYRGVDLSLAWGRAAAWALQLDGTHRLQACQGALQRLQLRAAVKLQDAAWWRVRGDDEIWDSGWVPPDEPAAWQALARFQPRRPSFVVLHGLPPAEVHRLLHTLHGRSRLFLQPLRVLVLGAADLGAEVHRLPD